MEPLPAAPPARGTSKGGSAPRATTPSGPAPSLPPRWGPQKIGPVKVPGAPQPRFGRSRSPFPAVCKLCPGHPACLVPGPARYLRGAAPLFVERRARDLLPRRRLRPSCRRLRPAFQRPPARRPKPCAAAARCTTRPLAGGGGAYGHRHRRRRTTFPTRGCVTGRHVPSQRGSAPSGQPERAGRRTRVPP